MKIESSIEKVSRDKTYKSVKNVKSVYLSVTWMPPLQTELWLKIPQVRMLIIHEKGEPAGHKLSKKLEIGRQIMQKVISMWNIKVILTGAETNKGCHGLITQNMLGIWVFIMKD